MTDILVGVLFFTAIVMVLVAVITAARRMLLPAGGVSIRVNRESVYDVSPGGKLLHVLAGQGLFLPAACAGGGTCGLCRVRVLSGGGALLRTESAHIHRRDARRGMRLACQVPVKRDLEVEVPADILSARQWRCRVRSNASVATFVKEPILELPPDEHVAFQAGGYIQVHAPPHDVRFRDFVIEEPYRDAWEGLWHLESHVDEELTRAYSMANYPGERGVIVLNVRIATPPWGTPPGTPPGRVSSFLFSLKPDEEVTISGPFGDFFIHESDAEMVYVGGGCGMAPLRSHIFELLKGRDSKRRISYWYGARNLREMFYRDDFEQLEREHDNFRFELALSEPLAAEAWTGPTGFIHQVVYDSYLKEHPAPEDAEYYVCGPPPMMKAVREMLDDLGVEPDNIFYDEFGS